MTNPEYRRARRQLARQLYCSETSKLVGNLPLPFPSTHDRLELWGTYFVAQSLGRLRQRLQQEGLPEDQFLILSLEAEQELLLAEIRTAVRSADLK